MKLPFKKILSNIFAIISLSGLSLTALFALLGQFFEVFKKMLETFVNIPAILLFILVAVFIYTLIIEVKRIIYNIKKPNYLNITKMDYKEWKIEWSYDKDYNPVDIKAVCNRCGCKLKPDTHIGITKGCYCPNKDCGEKYINLPDMSCKSDIMDNILYIINRGLSVLNKNNNIF